MNSILRSSPAEAPPWFRLRGALAFCAPMLAVGVILPFFPVWLKSLSFSENQIALVLAVPMIVRVLVAPAVTFLADRLDERADVLVWSGVLALLTALLLYFAHGFWPVLLLYCLQNAVFSPYVPVVEAILITGVRRWGYDYGGMRVWGSLAFVGATLVAGEAIGNWGGAAVLPMMLAGFVVTALMGTLAPRVGKARLPAVDTTSGPRINALSRLDLQLLLIGVALVQSSHGMLYAFSSIAWKQEGVSGTAIGLLWSAAVLAEVCVFFVSGRLVRLLGPWTMIRLGCAIAVCRWLLFPMPLGFFGYLVLQLSHAFTYAFVHTGIQRRIVESVGEEQESSAQGNYFFYNGGFLAAATLLSGPLYRQFGASGYFFMAGVAFIGLLIVIGSWYLQPERRLRSPNSDASTDGGGGDVASG